MSEQLSSATASSVMFWPCPRPTAMKPADHRLKPWEKYIFHPLSCFFFLPKCFVTEMESDQHRKSVWEEKAPPCWECICPSSSKSFPKTQSTHYLWMQQALKAIVGSASIFPSSRSLQGTPGHFSWGGPLRDLLTIALLLSAARWKRCVGWS
jgi:hypothetical protein